MISQSEHNIKKSALRFLKMYYKHRPRSGETQTKMDQTTQDGVIADGLLSFPQEDGKSFVASVEATSFDTRDEVKYKTQNHLLYWDSLMWGTVVVACFCLIGHYAHWFTFANHEWQLVIFLSTLVGIIFLIYQYFFQRRTKYRYIYALQQFKQYHADEQWVAIGDNVFYGPEDPALEELKKQCVKNGFGLLTIDKDLQTHLVISPSREELFGSSRKILSFIGMDNLSEGTTMKSARGLWGFIKKKLGWESTGMDLRRYQRNFYRPLFTSILMVGLIGFVAYEDLREKEIVYVEDEAAYDAQITEMNKDKPFDEFDQKIDSSLIISKPKKVPDSYVAINEPNKRNESVMSRAPLQRKDELTPKGADPEIMVHGKNKGFTGYDCSRFFNIEGQKYAVQDSWYETIDQAERRINLLKRSGFKANLLWLGCFDSSRTEYMVFIDFLYETKDEAIKEGVKYRKLLKTQDIPKEKLNIRTLQRK